MLQHSWIVATSLVGRVTVLCTVLRQKIGNKSFNPRYHLIFQDMDTQHAAGDPLPDRDDEKTVSTETVLDTTASAKAPGGAGTSSAATPPPLREVGPQGSTKSWNADNLALETDSARGALHKASKSVGILEIEANHHAADARLAAKKAAKSLDDAGTKPLPQSPVDAVAKLEKLQKLALSGDQGGILALLSTKEPSAADLANAPFDPRSKCPVMTAGEEHAFRKGCAAINAMNERQAILLEAAKQQVVKIRSAELQLPANPVTLWEEKKEAYEQEIRAQEVAREELERIRRPVVSPEADRLRAHAHLGALPTSGCRTCGAKGHHQRACPIVSNKDRDMDNRLRLAETVARNRNAPRLARGLDGKDLYLCAYIWCTAQETHTTNVCPTLHNRCEICKCRGHHFDSQETITDTDILGEPQPPTMEFACPLHDSILDEDRPGKIRRAQGVFEETAGIGQGTCMREQVPALGFFPASTTATVALLQDIGHFNLMNQDPQHVWKFVDTLEQGLETIGAVPRHVPDEIRHRVETIVASAPEFALPAANPVASEENKPSCSYTNSGARPKGNRKPSYSSSDSDSDGQYVDQARKPASADMRVSSAEFKEYSEYKKNKAKGSAKSNAKSASSSASGTGGKKTTKNSSYRKYVGSAEIPEWYHGRPENFDPNFHKRPHGPVEASGPSHSSQRGQKRSSVDRSPPRPSRRSASGSSSDRGSHRASWQNKKGKTGQGHDDRARKEAHAAVSALGKGVGPPRSGSGSRGTTLIVRANPPPVRNQGKGGSRQ